MHARRSSTMVLGYHWVVRGLCRRAGWLRLSWAGGLGGPAECTGCTSETEAWQLVEALWESLVMDGEFITVEVKRTVSFNGV